MEKSLTKQVAEFVRTILPEVKNYRQQYHSNPELTWNEKRTGEDIARKLSSIPGIKVQSNVAKFGVLGSIEGSSNGPTVALRADMDALPIHEDTGLSYASQLSGVQHACGHDGHMANLLGTAKVIAKFRKELKGRVLLIFQPAEEGGGGAKVMIDEGILENEKVDVVFGLHGWPTLPCGTIATRPDAIMAATLAFRIEIIGKGGHAAMPHLAVDPMIIASHCVQALQTISSRTIDPTDPVVLSVTTIKGGSAFNVIPEKLSMQGTLRTISDKTQSDCIKRIKEIISHTSAAFGGKGEVHIENGYPPTLNHHRQANYIRKVVENVLGKENYHPLPTPSLGGEDFAYFLQKVPGAFFFLGLDDGRAEGYPSLHHPKFDFNDAALENGIRTMSHLALAWANEPE
ncbi:MAG: M20 family metallopeptidase [Oligoflexales bacterium]